MVEAPAQGGARVVNRLPVLLPALPPAHVVEFLEHLVRGASGLVQDGAGLGLSLLHRFGPLGLHSGPVLPHRLRGLLHLPPEFLGGLLLLLHLLALFIQLGEHIFKADIFRINPGRSPLNDILGQAKPLRNGKGVGFPWNADKKTVGRGQGLHVELTGGVLHPFCGHGIHLELRIMGGGGHQGPQFPGALNDGGGQSGSLNGVGARPQLVKQNQCTVVRLL